MSLDLSVLSDKRVTKRLMESINTFLTLKGFYKDEFGYSSGGEQISLDIYIDLEAEKDDYWDEGKVRAIDFTPMTQIALESRHTEESHRTSYLLAKELAKIIGGVIYDHQVDVVYDSEGNPYAHYRTDDQLEEYGTGVNLFMNAIEIAKDMLDTKE